MLIEGINNRLATLEAQLDEVKSRLDAVERFVGPATPMQTPPKPESVAAPAAKPQVDAKTASAATKAAPAK